MHNIARQKPYNNGPLHSYTVIGILAVVGVGCYIWYSEKGPGRAAVSPSLHEQFVQFWPSSSGVSSDVKCRYWSSALCGDGSSLDVYEG